jgi:hypothetical protein
MKHPVLRSGTPLRALALVSYAVLAMSMPATAQSGSFQSGTLLGPTGLPAGTFGGTFGGRQGVSPGGRAFYAPSQILMVPVEAPLARHSFDPRRQSDSAPPAPPRIISVDGRRTTQNRVTVINGSSPSLRPETGPKIIRIER